MLDRTDFESWQQRIRLYCLGKDNGENIMKSITEGPFKMGRSHTKTPAEKMRTSTHHQHYYDAKDIWDNVKMILEGSELTKDDRESQLYDEFEHFCQIKGETIHGLTSRKDHFRGTCRGNVVAGMLEGGGNVNPREQVTNFDDDVDDPNEKDLALNVDHIFEADQCDAFDSDVDEAIYKTCSYENNRKKAETSVPKPPLALTVCPPNTLVKLVPRVLPTKSQVKINLYVLTQLFTEFDKTCKKRITPTGVTEGERGFEQTKRCYLTEVIPFFKTLKEHFAGVQTALFKEVKVMEEIFDQMNDEVDQNTVDKQCAKIVKKNLLIENENLIANCLSNQLLYDVEKSRCLDLEAEMSKVHNESKHISKLEREYLNLQLKYQHLQESFDNNKSQTSQEAPDFNSFFKIKNLEHHIQEKDNVIRDLKVLVSNVNDRSYEPYNANDVTDLLE
ncbi:hypothetical protein Tco_0814941 [Tanacetum coccineum]